MVKLEEVVDEEFLREQEGPHDEDDWDTDSDTSSIADITPDETLYERLAALQDIIPAHTRRSIASKYNTATSWAKSGLSLGGKTLWVISTSALLLGVPWALAYSEEQMIVEQERAEMMNQRAQNEVSQFKMIGADACGR
ncbi:mitochondrial import receptor subunit Tom22 [Kalmusia sp. IMI 367209]|nr:mitochondrial import receptor subunit Tom22 [Kalmusia sp. IMI 367209]